MKSSTKATNYKNNLAEKTQLEEQLTALEINS